MRRGAPAAGPAYPGSALPASRPVRPRDRRVAGRRSHLSRQRRDRGDRALDPVAKVDGGDEFAIVLENVSDAGEAEVVAEGVENGAQLDFLRAQGCDLMQGYFFSHPLEADLMTALLQGTRSDVLPGLFPIRSAAG
ncbi:MAG: EAL domain-containing protein [Betaproteobacteria bacterium]|nr:EAL domain-containing protein [Betaproteobacteria bacterium]